MDQCEFNGKTLPASNKYTPSFRLTKSREPSWWVGKEPKKEHWKPKKKAGPDVGSYEPLEKFKKTGIKRP